MIDHHDFQNQQYAFLNHPNFKYSDLKPLEDKFETMAREAVFKKLEI